MAKRVEPPENIPVLAEKQALRIKQAANKDAFDTALVKARQQQHANTVEKPANQGPAELKLNNKPGQETGSVRPDTDKSCTARMSSRFSANTGLSETLLALPHAWQTMIEQGASQTPLANAGQFSTGGKLLNQGVFSALLKQLQMHSNSDSEQFTLDIASGNSGLKKIIADKDGAGCWHIQLLIEENQADESDQLQLSLHAQSKVDELKLALQREGVAVGSVCLGC